MVVADDEEQLVVRRTVEQVGDHTRGDINRDERIERQHPAVRGGFARPQPEADDGQAGQHDETVGQEDARRELDAREFLQQHRHDVGAARGRLLAHDDALPHADDDGADDARQQQVVRQVEPPAQQQRRVEALDRRGVGIDQPCEHVHKAGRIERGQHRTRSELPAENQHRNEHQRHVEHIAERTHLDRRKNVVQHDTHTVHASRHEIVRVHKQHEAGTHDRTPEKDQEPRAPPRPRAHRFQ